MSLLFEIEKMGFLMLVLVFQILLLQLFMPFSIVFDLMLKI